MRRVCLIRLVVSAALVPAGAGVAGAHETPGDLFKRIDKFADAEEARRDAKLAKLRLEIREIEKQLQNLSGMSDSLALEGEGKLRAAAASREREWKRFVESPADQKSETERQLRRIAPLELGRLYAAMGRYDVAAERLRTWIAHKDLYHGQKDQVFLVHDLTLAAATLVKIEQPHDAVNPVDEAIRLCRQMRGPYARPEENPLLPPCLLVRARVANATGNHLAARDRAAEALKLIRQQHAGEAVQSAEALNVRATARQALGDAPAAFVDLQEALKVLDSDLGPVKKDLARAEVRTSLALLYFERGEEPAGRETVKQALNDYRAFFPPNDFPKGHPGLIRALCSLGDMLSRHRQNGDAEKQHAQAEKLHEEALRSCEQFYPHAHPVKLATLLSYAQGKSAAGKLVEARDAFAKAETLARELYPDHAYPNGHAYRALCLARLGGAQARLGDYRTALATLERSRAMYDEVYPQGHPDVPATLQRLGEVRMRLGMRREAAEAFAEALGQDQKNLSGFTRGADEAEALAYARPRRQSLYGYLAVTRDGGVADGDVYARVWAAKNPVTRQVEERRAATRSAMAKSPKVAELREQLIDARSRVARFSAADVSPSDRAAKLAETVNECNRIVNRLEEELPDYRSRVALAHATPRELAEALPPGAAFIDIVAYAAEPGADAPVSHYAAFVLTPGGNPVRAELGRADQIRDAVEKWRAAVTNWQARAPSGVRAQNEAETERQAARIAELAWLPIARKLGPTDTKVLYVSTDGDLARFPFAALPTGQGEILLERYQVNVVPHGPFLLEQLRKRRSPLAEAAGDMLVVAAVNYGGPGGAGRLTPLQTSVEARPPGGAVKLRELLGDAATGAAVCRGLQSAVVAHFDTHGGFDQALLDEEKGVLQDYFDNWDYHGPASATRFGLRLRSPQNCAWLALAGADQADSNSAEGGHLRAGTISELALQNLRLAVLAACETGVGEVTPNEGVQSLHRAFHLAGCPNVVFSLWNTSDSATRVLMKEFYRQLWEGKQAPPEALRLAQLAVYRHPELLAGWKPSAGATRPASARAPAKLWAGFVFSGAGE
jgi:CHAT domain-containing protein